MSITHFIYNLYSIVHSALICITTTLLYTLYHTNIYSIVNYSILYSITLYQIKNVLYTIYLTRCCIHMYSIYYSILCTMVLYILYKPILYHTIIYSTIFPQGTPHHTTLLTVSPVLAEASLILNTEGRFGQSLQQLCCNTTLYMTTLYRTKLYRTTL